jgi:hypothetical protein
VEYKYKTIPNPQLTPKAGYVEDEDETGARVYRPTEETTAAEALAQRLNGIDELTLDLVYRQVLLEWGVTI